MICRPCKEAGQHTAEARKNEGRSVEAALAQEAVRLHQECEHPTTCPCQHRASTLLLAATAPRDLGAFSNNSG